MNDKPWKKDFNYRKDKLEYYNDNPRDNTTRYDSNKSKRKVNSRSSSRHNYSLSRSNSKGRRKDRRRNESSVSGSVSRSPSFRNDNDDKNININKPINQKGPALDFMIFFSHLIEKSLNDNGILKKVINTNPRLKIK
jgi:hypothetical protein